jgi:hypothetical protein
VKKYLRIASVKQPSLAKKRVSPHSLRHYAGFRTIPGELVSEAPGSTLVRIFPA